MFGLQKIGPIWYDHSSFTRSVSALQMTPRAKRAYSQNGFELSLCYSTEQRGRVPSGCINEKTKSTILNLLPVSALAAGNNKNDIAKANAK